ncbi:hypothetical protein ACXAUS_003433 [Clostridium sporogenes]
MTIDRFIEYIEFYKKNGKLTGNEKMFADKMWLSIYSKGEEIFKFNCNEK